MMEEIYTDSEEYLGPKQSKGGTFAPNDIVLIKKLLLSYMTDSSYTMTPAEEQQAINLYHRLNRIS
jgi:hypothetical protein